MMMWLLLAARAFANEAGHGTAEAGAETLHAIPWKSVFVQGFNLVFLLALLFFILRKTVKAHFENRAHEYRQLVARAEAARNEAEKGRREVKDRLAKLDESNSHVLEKAKAEAAELRSRMNQEAKAAALRLEQEAARTVKGEVERAKAELRRELLQAAIQASRENLQKNLSPGEQKKLQREFGDKIQVVGG